MHENTAVQSVQCSAQVTAALGYDSGHHPVHFTRNARPMTARDLVLHARQEAGYKMSASIFPSSAGAVKGKVQIYLQVLSDAGGGHTMCAKAKREDAKRRTTQNRYFVGWVGWVACMRWMSGRGRSPLNLDSSNATK